MRWLPHRTGHYRRWICGLISLSTWAYNKHLTIFGTISFDKELKNLAKVNKIKNVIFWLCQLLWLFIIVRGAPHTELFRGLVMLKKIQKSEKNSDLPDTTMFLETWKQHKKQTKNTKFPQKNNNPSWGLTHPPTFSDFWNFFNLTKPLSTCVFLCIMCHFGLCWLGERIKIHWLLTTAKQH